MNNINLKGCFTAIVTPFTKTGALDENAFLGLIDWQIEAGISGIVVCGTTGESVTLDDAEYLRVMELAIHHINNRVPVICGAGGNNTRKVIKLAHAAEELGADAILSVSPYYNKPSQRGIIMHYTALADAVRIPIILYNVPGRTGSNMTAETVLQLASIENIIAVKEASGNLGQVIEILRDCPQDFAILSGDDALTLPMIACGADGVISVIANQIPKAFSELTAAALRGDFAHARKLQNKYLHLMNLNFIESNPVPVKTSLAFMRRINETVRLPLAPMSTENRGLLRDELLRLNLLPDEVTAQQSIAETLEGVLDEQ